MANTKQIITGGIWDSIWTADEYNRLCTKFRMNPSYEIRKKFYEHFHELKAREDFINRKH